MGLFPIGSLIPVRTIKNIRLAIMIHIRRGRAFGVKDIGQPLGGEANGWRGEDGGGGKCCEDDEFGGAQSM